MPENKFLAVYAGNLGVKHGLDQSAGSRSVFRAMRTSTLSSATTARSAMCWSSRFARSSFGTFHALQQGEDYIALLADADVCFITQQSGTGNPFFPSNSFGALRRPQDVRSPMSALRRSQPRNCRAFCGEPNQQSLFRPLPIEKSARDKRGQIMMRKNRRMT